MKYILTIEGTKDEIEKHEAATTDYAVGFNWERVVVQDPFSRHVMKTEIEVQFKIVEPKYRVKTLKELVDEFGDAVKLWADGIGVDPYYTFQKDLGKEATNIDLNMGDKWKKIFLTGVKE